jgi:2OG-Fe(II) oxygenase superfamily
VNSDFEKAGYFYLENFLDKGSCSELTEQLKLLVEDEKTTRDTQCPSSEGIYGAVTFDSILEELMPKFEYVLGYKLLPTYSYARLYKPGERLAVHKDRPSCEISATITIGFDGDPWPIYFENDEEGSSKFDMQIGDAVLYKGEERFHWRNKYTEGKWQAQVFLHYVKEDGKNKTHKYDGRNSLSHHNHSNSSTEDLLFHSVEDFYSVEQTERIIQSILATNSEKAKIGHGEGILDTSVRDVNIIPINLNSGISNTIFGATVSANYKKWKFDITHQSQCDFLIYDKDGHYNGHIDTYLSEIKEVRKLTSLIFLNDNFSGGRLYLKIGDEKIYPPQKKGSLLVFPSFILHGVEPVLSGVRKTIVSWANGPWFK